MVGLGTLLFLLALWYGLTWLFRRDMPKSRWFLRIASVAGVAAVIAMEAGWVVSEVGRQPWIVYDQMKVEDAATGNTGVWITFIADRRPLHRARDHHGAHPAQDEPALPRARRRRPSTTCRTGRAIPFPPGRRARR